jgi:1-acyl-sn-glycerol-3-phosphate acyltransferase
MGNGFTRWVGDMILKAMGWTLVGKLPNLKKAIIIGGPHTSNWDLFLAMGSMLSVGLKFSWMMKKEAFFWPLGGLWKALGGIPINRKAKTNVMDQVKNWFETRDVVWLGITPEGTRSKVDSYKTGYLRIAKAVGVPLFIVGIDAINKRVVLDRVWDPKGDINTENAAIKTYIEANYTGIRN